jgi:hypothetical protein
MFDLSRSEQAPEAVVFGIPEGYTREGLFEAVLPGKWWRVQPTDAKEIFALRLLEHRVDKFAPADGHGVLITDQAMRQFRSGKKANAALTPAQIDDLLSPKLPKELRKRKSLKFFAENINQKS